jgi:hypothetical protein
MDIMLPVLVTMRYDIRSLPLLVLTYEGSLPLQSLTRASKGPAKAGKALERLDHPSKLA